jgi:hypothetical protein
VLIRITRQGRATIDSTLDTLLDAEREAVVGALPDIADRDRQVGLLRELLLAFERFDEVSSDEASYSCHAPVAETRHGRMGPDRRRLFIMALIRTILVPAAAPLFHRLDDWAQGIAGLGQRVLDTGRSLTEAAAADDAGVFQFPQPLGQHAVGHTAGNP